MGRENIIQTGTSTPNDFNKFINPQSKTYKSINLGIVISVNELTREIIYAPLHNNISLNKKGIAKPSTNNFQHLPKPGYIIKLKSNSDSSISNISESGKNTVYYEPSPIGVWQSVDNNKVEIGPNVSDNPVDINISDIKNADIGVTKNNPLKTQYNAILIGGLDENYNRKKNFKTNYKSLKEQLELFKKGYGANKIVEAFHYDVEVNNVLAFLSKNPKIPVFTFSAGCDLSDEISNSPNADKTKIFIIEPYAKSGNSNIVRAVSNGVPSKNVFVGASESTGVGVVKNTSYTGVTDHWSALTVVGKKFSNL
jgi:hypothetical protein